MLRRPTSRLAVALCALALALAAVPIAGCGSSSSGNGVASKSPSEILAAAKSAAGSASSVHVAGSLHSGGMALTLDLNLVSGRGGRGRISEGGLAFDLIVVGDTVYIKGSLAFYSHFVGATAAQLFQGKWLKAPVGGGELASLASLTNLGKLLEQALSSQVALVRGPTTTVDSEPVVELHDSARTISLYVATTGKPYPIEVVKHGAEAGRVSFTDWDAPVTLTAPSGAVNLGQLGSGGH